MAFSNQFFLLIRETRDYAPDDDRNFYIVETIKISYMFYNLGAIDQRISVVLI